MIIAAVPSMKKPRKNKNTKIRRKMTVPLSDTPRSIFTTICGSCALAKIQPRACADARTNMVLAVVRDALKNTRNRSLT